MEEHDKLVEAIERGQIVKVTEFYAKKENLPILRKSLAEELRKKIIQKSPGIPNNLKDQHKKPFPEMLSHPKDWKGNQVTSELIENFHWVIRIERRRKGLSRKQFSKILNESEENLKMLESGFLPSSDFVLINKIQQHLGINLRKDKKDYNLGIKEMMKPTEPAIEKQKKQIFNNDFSGKDIEILENEI
jgi:ribosome-binding protein aMBF1 (putative translation factor)